MRVMIRKVLINLLVVVSAFVLLFLIGEISIRTLHYFKYGRPFLVLNGSDTFKHILVEDARLGWKPSSYYQAEYKKANLDGSQYSVQYRTYNGGFRYFGDPMSVNIKIFVIGDSFTHAVEVSNDLAYYSMLQGAFMAPIELFAFGAGGYGTLQQLMVLDKYIDHIRPHIVLLQLCSNDFINNSFALEKSSLINNNGMRRPYIDQNGALFYDIPKAGISLFVRRINSRFAYWLLLRLNMLVADLRIEETIETEIQIEGRSHPGFQRAVSITEDLVKRFVKRIARRASVYAFSVDNDEPFYSAFKLIMKKNGVRFLDGVPQAIRMAEKRGEIVRARDGAHWNVLGHRIAAKVLAGGLRDEVTRLSNVVGHAQ